MQEHNLHVLSLADASAKATVGDELRQALNTLTGEVQLLGVLRDSSGQRLAEVLQALDEVTRRLDQTLVQQASARKADRAFGDGAMSKLSQVLESLDANAQQFGAIASRQEDLEQAQAQVRTTIDSVLRALRDMTDAQTKLAELPTMIQVAVDRLEQRVERELAQFAAIPAMIQVAVDRLEQRLERELAQLADSARGTHAIAEEQSQLLRRIEAALFSLKKRAEPAKPLPDNAAPATSGPHKPIAAPSPAERLARAQRKLVKLARDPERFFQDATSPIVRDTIKDAYLRFIRR